MPWQPSWAAQQTGYLLAEVKSLIPHCTTPEKRQPGPPYANCTAPELRQKKGIVFLSALMPRKPWKGLVYIGISLTAWSSYLLLALGNLGIALPTIVMIP